MRGGRAKRLKLKHSGTGKTKSGRRDKNEASQGMSETRGMEEELGEWHGRGEGRVVRRKSEHKCGTRGLRKKWHRGVDGREARVCAPGSSIETVKSFTK